MVATTKTLFRDALVGFALGLLVVSAVALATWHERSEVSEKR